MKVKKALRRLDHVGSLLADVMAQLAGNYHDVKELLGSAKADVARAVKMLEDPAPATKPKAAVKRAAEAPKKPATKKKAAAPKKTAAPTTTAKKKSAAAKRKAAPKKT